MTDVMVVLTTVPAAHTDALVRGILGKRLAACVNEFPVRSHYWWHDAIVDEEERMLIMKTTREHVQALIGAIRVLHPYEIPEIIALPVQAGFAGYLAWVVDETGERHPVPDGNCF
jgi:periplasmic divalent cation tolerance protein